MRGEDVTPVAPGVEGTGSPPHARGRRERRIRLSHCRRITPACAGKTSPMKSSRKLERDHPRMRGEDGSDRFPCGRVEGSPPHARGRLPARPVAGRRPRITPACAGKTSSTAGKPNCQTDHPRMRGEDRSVPCWTCTRCGSPPHARGRHLGLGNAAANAGITPACAGKTPSSKTSRTRGADHPRMRGEDPGVEVAWRVQLGSPPHARGRLAS